ncbi:PhzF family phenazine biosynthesis protein [Ktedonobacter sp. SOSP1-52]|uniref:PhzF family phenazine biosynthesis protein n=1 Tax=Ktedonobacter sp. SOSP1-52 TaxID=2778366 RepID=UPI001915B7DC|nr:PhzF family phenazine biosynthesis protein [Ktedonobacter sp. SOSP1-52]
MHNKNSRPYHFRVVDVFADHIFGGNQLAVFLDGTGLTEQEMLAITREMNFSETTFLFPPSQPGSHARVRIFTPAGEIPFAGHPTLGTAFVLATNDLLLANTQQIVLEEGVGPITVRLSGEPSAPEFLWTTLPPLTFRAPFENREAIAEALGLSTADLLSEAPIQLISTGNAFVYIPLRSRSLVEQVEVNMAQLRTSFAGVSSLKLYIFALEPQADEQGRFHAFARMLKPYQNSIVEDSATGSAAGPLGAYLAQHGLIPCQDEAALVVEQGTQMGRQSFLHIHVRRQDDALSVDFGGSVVPVYEGILRLPPR